MRQFSHPLFRLLGLIGLVFLTAVPGSAETSAVPSAGPMVRVHGSETWAPVLELALDEVHMQWIGEPRRAATPPVLTEGASAEHVGRDSAVVRLAAVTSVTELVARARALRDANPQWQPRLVLYTPGTKHDAKNRRLLTEEIAVVTEDGTLSREHAGDPLRILELAQTIAARPGVARVEPVPEAPDFLRARLKRKFAKL